MFADSSPLLHFVAPPQVKNYDIVMPRYRYVIFPTPDSSRDIELSCPIRPGALEDSYSVEWQASNPGSEFAALEDKAYYDISVSITPSLKHTYRCMVSIQHRNTVNATMAQRLL